MKCGICKKNPEMDSVTFTTKQGITFRIGICDPCLDKLKEYAIYRISKVLKREERRKREEKERRKKTGNAKRERELKNLSITGRARDPETGRYIKTQEEGGG